MPVSRDSALAATETRRMINNLLHIPAYGVLAWLWTAQFRAWLTSRRTYRTLLAGCLAAAAFGGLIELAQCAIRGRKGTAGDFLLNCAGVAGAALLLAVSRSGRKRRRESDGTDGNEARRFTEQSR